MFYFQKFDPKFGFKSNNKIHFLKNSNEQEQK